MTREEAIKSMEYSKAQAEITLSKGVTQYWKQEINWTIEAIDMAIEALKRERTDEWCTGCKEYDTEKKCCPRFNRVIRGALEREPSEDGTLEVKVEDATKIGRVLISDDKHRGGLYYPDEDEPQKKYPTEWCEQCTLWEDNKCIGVAQCKNNIEALKQAMNDDLISRAEAIEAIEIVDWYHQNSNKDMVHGANDDEHQAWYKADDVYKALEAVPPADRQRGEWIEETSWKYKKGGRNSDMKEILGTEWMTMIRQRCSECNKVTMVDGSILYKYCPHCGARMDGERSEE